MSEPARCRLCSDPATEGGLCAEHALAAQMAPEPDESVFCGACGIDWKTGDEGWVLRTSRDGGVWARCPQCVEEWKRRRRDEERTEKATQAQTIPTHDWRWIRNRYEDVACLLCGDEIELGAKCLYIRELHEITCPSCWGRTRYWQGEETREAAHR